ncbi:MULTISPECIES: hypothetical protein [unclassified Streptomyces]|uniref:hypothetical protein n=1 Tax=unclassified Streptomyces TaxID=2593676 RepID=UPI001F3E38DA|nr:hypothetical protein [Streptomyces sp. NRRL F-2747]
MTAQLAEPATRTWQAHPYADALRTGQGPLFLRRRDGWLLSLETSASAGTPEPCCAAPPN